jgi:gliding motility-associated-like protein
VFCLPVFRHVLQRLLPLAISFFIGLTAVQAQLCTGSLGDPVVNITFGGSGSSTVPTVPGYTYTNSSCPNDGFYTITNHSANCFGNTWHSVSDHTGGGGFMLVNASFTAGDFFVATVTDLCPNTNYEFAAWIVNVMRPNGILPNITFTIETPDGTILKQFGTGDIDKTASPEWKQYGFNFMTPPTNAVIVLRMRNNAPGGIGNDVGLDDITFRPCGSLIDAGIVNYPEDTVDVCEGNTDQFTLTADVSSGYVSPLFQWQLSLDEGATWKDIPGATTTSYTRLPTAAPGVYWYRLSVVEASYAGIPSCRIASDKVIIKVHPKPIVNAGSDRTLISGNSIRIPATATGEDISVLWTPDNYMDDAALLTPTVSPPFETTYTLTATSAFGCTNFDNVVINVVAGIFVPTAFTPNNDGKNDTWQIPFLDPALEATVSVFNRYGQRVYFARNEWVSWDGTLKGQPQASGAYVYLVTFRGSKKILKGTVMLTR